MNHHSSSGPLDPRTENGHVDHLLRELAERTLSQRESDLVAEHIGECTDCAREAQFVREFRDAALQQGFTHLAPERLVAYVEDRAPLLRFESEHLDTCATCQEDIAVLHSLPEIAETPAETSGTLPNQVGSANRDRPGWRPFGGRRLVFAGWFGGALAMTALALVLFGPFQSIDTRSLAQIDQISLRIPRSVPEAGSFDEGWLQAVTFYQRSEFEKAERSLRDLVARDPSHFEATLLLGSALLLGGRLDVAIPILERAEQLAPTRAEADEARWQHANGLLARSRKNEVRLAIALLEMIASGPSERAAAAAQLRSEVGQRIGD